MIKIKWKERKQPLVISKKEKDASQLFAASWLPTSQASRIRPDYFKGVRSRGYNEQGRHYILVPGEIT